MKLDIDLTRLIKARESIGAEPAKIDTILARAPEYKNPFEAKLLEQGRVILDKKELSENVYFPGGIAAIGDQQIILYIYQPHVAREDLELNPAPKPKYHLGDCKTLKQMRRDGRYNRYVADRSGKDNLLIQPKNMETGQWEEKIEARLLPCINCLRQFEIDIDPMEFSSQDLKDFFEVNKPIFRCLPLFSRENYPGGGYTKDWSVISRKLRERANWRCSQCAVDLSQKQDRGLLQGHHINGIPGDNRSSNLKVLCVLCHREQPLHGHMPVKDSERQRIEKLRGK